MKKSFVVALFACGSSTFALAAPNMTGNWAVHRNVVGNESDSTCTFVQKEAAITGSCKSESKDVPVTGSVEGNKVTWSYTVDYQGSPLTMTYTATVDDSGKVAGSVDVQPFGVTGEFTATPMKEGGK